MSEPRAQLSVRRFAALAGALLLSACGIFEPYVPPPLPGERLSVLSLQQRIEPDPRIQDVEIRLTRPYANPSWPQAGGSAANAMYHLALGDAPRQIWRANIGAGARSDHRITASPIASQEAVFAMDSEGQVTAVSAANGNRLWRVSIVPSKEDPGALGGGLAYSQGILFVSTGYGEVIAFEAANGREFWRQRIGVPIRGAPTVFSSRVFVIGIDNQLFALAADDGRTLWNHVGIAESAGLLGSANAVASGEFVVAPFSSGELTALRIDNGRPVWSDSLARAGRVAALGDLSDLNGRPVIDRGTVYALGFGGRMVATDLASGNRLWSQNIAGTESPWIGGDFLFLISAEQEIIAVSREDGSIRWVTELPRYERADRRDPIKWSGPVLASDRLILLSSAGNALAVSPYTGETLGSLRLPDKALVPPIIANETLYILTDGGDLVAYR